MTDYKEEFVNLFTAQISSAFLDMFNKPESPPTLPAREPILIQHMYVPLKPYETFHLRMLPLLLDPHDTYMRSGKTDQT
jgi:hypothetical protein